MIDYIEFERIWQDSDFFEVKIVCVTEIIKVKSKLYLDDYCIDILSNKIKTFIQDQKEIIWENGRKGDESTAYLSFRFCSVDKHGHVLIEIYMEIDDGGSFSKHNCCFYINTELEPLTKFQKDLAILKKPILGNKVILNSF